MTGAGSQFANDTLPHLLLETAMGHEAYSYFDEALVNQMASGQKRGLEILYQRHGRQMYAYALRLVWDPTTAEDVLQESLAAAWHGAGKLRGEGRVIAWLLGIVRNKAKRALRGRTRGSRDGAEAESLDTGPTRDESTTRGERARTLRSGLA